MAAIYWGMRKETEQEKNKSIFDTYVFDPQYFLQSQYFCATLLQVFNPLIKGRLEQRMVVN